MTKPSILSALNMFLRLYTKLLALVTVCYWTQVLIVTYVTAANAVHAQVDYLDTHHECLTNFCHETDCGVVFVDPLNLTKNNLPTTIYLQL